MRVSDDCSRNDVVIQQEMGGNEEELRNLLIKIYLNDFNVDFQRMGEIEEELKNWWIKI